MSNLIPTKEDILNEILLALVEGKDLGDTSRILYAQLREVVPIERLGIAFISRDRKFLISRINISEAPIKLVDGYRARISSSTLRNLLDNNKSRIINDLGKYLESKPESEGTRLMVEEGVASSVSVPLISNGKAIGILFIASTDKGAYGQGHIDIVNHLAPIISIMLEKSLLLDSLKNSSDNYQEFIGQSGTLGEGANCGLNWHKSWMEWESFILSNILKLSRGKIYGKDGAAEILKLPPTTLQGKLKKLGLSRRDIHAHAMPVS